MAKILSVDQIRAADRYTIEHEPISSIDLMERASQAFVHWFINKFATDQIVTIYCGIGNNGGDGLAIARLLLKRQYDVKVIMVGDASKGSLDFKINYARWLDLDQPLTAINEAGDLPQLSSTDIIVDGLFGSGLSRPLEGLYYEIIHALNEMDATKVSIDIASGLFADKAAEGVIFQADYTVSFQLPKLAFLLPENAKFVGEWQVVDIGLSKEFVNSTSSQHTYLDHDEVAPLLRPRNKFDHKGNYGHTLLIAGSKGKMGAAILAARACLRSGAGLLTVLVPSVGLNTIQNAVPEAMAIADPCEDHISQVPEGLDAVDTVAIGPGIGQHPNTLAMLTQLLVQVDRPLVLDADALNLIGANRELLEKIPTDSILTPHPKEFQRLTKKFVDSFERLELQKRFTSKYNLTVLVKGAHSTITSRDNQIYFNSTGNPGMATAGSGDVLTGVVTGLLTQGHKPLTALQLGVYLHGAAGDIAAQQIGQNALIASDLIKSLPSAIRVLTK